MSVHVDMIQEYRQEVAELKAEVDRLKRLCISSPAS